MDFSDVLASSIHDIKNSLGLILNSLNELVNDPNNHIANPRQASLLQHETQRANSALIQLLNLYKIGNAQLVARINEHNLDDFFEDVLADNQAMCRGLNLELTHRCDPHLTGYFDADLIHGLLNSAIGNAGRYAKTKILLSATIEERYCVIRLEDDGAGFPDALIHCLPSENGLPQFIANDPSRTHLGLYFASRIAALHRNSDGRTGMIRLRNAHILSGSCFELWLP
ncbi:sensor histidine kinase [Chromatium okenii]|jgi:signal transduction histidine kinase|uniref:histidine kinase n=1 Tax=Chromatium okenii TaxID=61644 RepID=A0A2S7XNW4_9GAMM|nr:HAMP domain-containing sensor histidine kinase [Chromatium okenii]PQJ95429.1 sensor histidine kinase [Chromatium okenii]